MGDGSSSPCRFERGAGRKLVSQAQTSLFLSRQWGGRSYGTTTVLTRDRRAAPRAVCGSEVGAHADRRSATRGIVDGRRLACRFPIDRSHVGKDSRASGSELVACAN